MEPISVYLDHNILNDIAPAKQDWTTTKWGAYLLDQTQKGHIEVYASPTNCLEIALLTKDLDHRNNLARALNTLIAGHRMLPTYEFVIVQNLLRHINGNWPGTINESRFNRLQRQSARTYVALLGQLAALKDYDCSKGLVGAIAPKIITQLIQGEIFRNPLAELKKRLAGLQQVTVQSQDAFAAYDSKSLDELAELKESLLAETFTVDKQAIKFLKDNKAKFIEGYAQDELRSCIHQVFLYWEDLEVCFAGCEQVVREWATVHPLESSNPDFKPKPLPQEITAAYASGQSTRNDRYAVLKALGARFSSFLDVPKLYSSTVFNEMERTLNKGKLPTGGLALDCQHTLACAVTEFFLVRDAILLDTVKRWHATIREESTMFRESADGLQDFERKVEKRLKALGAD
ncbi:hypothetical protein ACFQT0_26845 [Hymenobacter humi]|uniref:DUF4935 domain-containing protein n=1 Tax=Hymenobacter humi TaxID=1411620 RepID=A0ABW2UCH6_9BACT